MNLIFLFPFCIFRNAFSNQFFNIPERIFHFEVIKDFYLALKQNNELLSSFKYKIKSIIIHDLLSTSYSYIYI